MRAGLLKYLIAFRKVAEKRAGPSENSSWPQPPRSFPFRFSEVGGTFTAIRMVPQYFSLVSLLKMSKSNDIYDFINNNRQDVKRKVFPYEITRVESEVNAQLLEDFTGIFFEQYGIVTSYVFGRGTDRICASRAEKIFLSVPVWEGSGKFLQFRSASRRHLDCNVSTIR